MVIAALCIGCCIVVGAEGWRNAFTYVLTSPHKAARSRPVHKRVMRNAKHKLRIPEICLSASISRYASRDLSKCNDKYVQEARMS